MKTILRLIAAGNLLAVLALAQAPRYTVTDLGNVGPNGQPFVVTNNGLVAGDAAAGSAYHAVVWFLGHEIDLKAALAAAGFTGPNNYALSVNLWAQAAGFAETSEADPHGEDFCGFGDHLVCLPYLTQLGLFRPTPLPTLGGKNGAAQTINDLGQAAGYAENALLDPACPPPQKYEFKPVLWTNGRAQELPTVSGDPEGLVWGVNDKGQTAGGSGVCASYNPISGNYLQSLHAILWDANGTPHEIPGLGGTGHGIGITAKTPNNQGQVVGWSDLPGDRNFHGFIWSNGARRDLGVLPGGVNSLGLGINDAGVVTGASLDAGFNPTAFIWQNGVITGLNSLIPADSPLLLETACSINSSGQIIGFAANKSNGQTHGYLLTPR
jgi:probable HAF family extracellular repeat protein